MRKSSSSRVRRKSRSKEVTRKYKNRKSRSIKRKHSKGRGRVRGVA